MLHKKKKPPPPSDPRDGRKSSNATDPHQNNDAHSNSKIDEVSVGGVDDIEQILNDPSKYNLKIKILHPESEHVDPSACRAPIIFAEVGGHVDHSSNSEVSGTQTVSTADMNKPSLLFITSYAVRDPTNDVQASLWTTDPFQPSSTDSTITACGVACDKASVVSAIEAVKSLVSAFGNKVPVNLKVLAVSLPPSSIVPNLDDGQYSTSEDGVLHPTKKLANFIEAHRDEILAPAVNVVLASKPGSFTSQFPDSVVGVFGGRGALQFDLCVELANSTPMCALESSNPISNPISALSTVIAKLLEESRSNSALNFRPSQSLGSMSDEAGDEQSQTTSELDRFLESPEVNAQFAKVYPSFHQDQSNFSLKKLFYKTTLVPTMISSSSTGCDDTSSRDYIPKSATCSFNVVLPVSTDVDVAYSKITSLVQGYVQEISSELVVSFSNVKKRYGWYSDPTTSLFTSLSNSFKSSFNSEYRPFIPSCEPFSSPYCLNISQAFHGVPTFFISLNDPHASVGGPNETVLLDDIHGMTEALVRFTFGLATGNPETSLEGASANSKPRPVRPHQERKSHVERKREEHKHEKHYQEEHKPAHEEHLGHQHERVEEQQPEQPQVQEQVEEEEQQPEQPQVQEQVEEEQQPEQSQVQEQVEEQQPEQSQVQEQVEEQQPEQSQVQEQVEEEQQLEQSQVQEQVEEQQQPERPQVQEQVEEEQQLEQPQVQEQVEEQQSENLPEEEKIQLNEEMFFSETNTQEQDTLVTEPAQLATEEPVVDYAKDSDDLFTELNEMRSNPAAYADKIAYFLDCFHQKDESDDKYLIFKPENGVHIQTIEGRANLESVLDILRSTPALPLFTRHEGMDKGANDLVEDQIKSGLTGHQSSDGSSSSDRISRYGQWFGNAGEVLVYLQPLATLRVIQLLCSDGDETRHTRTSILSPEFKVAGVASGPHPTNRNMAVVTLAAKYGPKGLNEAAVGTYTAETKTQTENFDIILQSIPVSEVHEAVQTAIEENNNVELDYTPGSIKITLTDASGASQVLECTWGADS